MPTIRSALILLQPFVAASLLLGAAVGIGAYTFVYARGASYLSNDPEACGNCHIMREHLGAWTRSSHHAVAACNDCHTPPGSVAKYVNKAANGLRHSLAFTTGSHPDPLRITDANSRVTEQACRSCHAQLVSAVDFAAHDGTDREHDDAAISCIRCHAAVGHWVR